jgi:hypothetical protein
VLVLLLGVALEAPDSHEVGSSRLPRQASCRGVAGIQSERVRQWLTDEGFRFVSLLPLQQTGVDIQGTEG